MQVTIVRVRLHATCTAEQCMLYAVIIYSLPGLVCPSNTGICVHEGRAKYVSWDLYVPLLYNLSCMDKL